MQRYIGRRIIEKGFEKVIQKWEKHFIGQVIVHKNLLENFESKDIFCLCTE